MTTTDEKAAFPDYPDYPRNATALAMDNALFSTGISFISTTTVLLAFLATLTSNEVLIGAASGLLGSAWLLPQLLVAGLATRQRRMKPMVLKAAWSTRPVLLPLALVVWLCSAKHPTLVFAVTVLAVFAFFVGDAFASVPWFSMLARVLPPQRRGRVMGLSSVLGGLGGIAAGMVVRYILGNPERFAYPGNYALLIVLGLAFILMSGVALICVREPDQPSTSETPPSFGQVLRSMPALLARDRGFRRLVITKLVLGFTGVASSFYVLYATRELGFQTAVTGYFVTAQVVGSVGSGLLLGYVQDKWGPLRHMRILMVLAAIPPVLAILAGLLQIQLPQAVLPLYLALYFFYGVAWTNVGWPFFNWILEYAPDKERPIYIGLTNTLGALTMFAPAIGGVLVRTVSYPAAFAVSIGFAVLSLAISLGLPSPRTRNQTP